MNDTITLPREELQEEKPEPVAWDVFVKHSHIYFSIGNQFFQLAFVPEDEPDMSAGQIAEWYMTQLRNALARLASTTPPQREYDKESDAVDTLTEEGWTWDGDQWQRGKAQQEEKPDPVAWFDKKMNGLIWKEGLLNCHFDDRQPFYTTPPQREWQGLTDEEIKDFYDDDDNFSMTRWYVLRFAHAIEAKLKEKNNG